MEFDFLPSDFFEKYRLPLTIGGIGVFITFIGLLLIFVIDRSEDKIEIIPAEETVETKEIMVDIEGEVLKPGVYKLPIGSRIENLLIMTGGLSPEADRDWIEKNLNRAQILSDGMKIFIPSKESQPLTTDLNKASYMLSSAKININAASADQLDILPGIGPKTAQKIIDNRPFGDLGELLSKKIVSKSVYEQIKERISLY